jgi:uncharacterized protein (UPF0210 family)
MVAFARELAVLCRENGLEYCSLGPVNSAGSVSDLLPVVPEIIAATETIFASASLNTTAGGPHPLLLAQEAAKVMQAISQRTAGGFGNLRFAATVNCPPHIPFFPAAYHQGAPAFSLALEAADLVAEALRTSGGVPAAEERVVQVMEEKLFPWQEISQRLVKESGYVFRGLDLSPAPGPARETSIAYALEELGLGRFGEPGTLTAAALVAGALKKTSLQTCGYSGLMLPVLEDSGLAERNNEGLVRLSSLLSYSAVCGTGLDTIPLPGDVSVEQLTAILLDVATLAMRLNKPLSARLFPIPGKKAGDMTEFDFPYFVNTRVMEVG